MKMAIIKIGDTFGALAVIDVFKDERNYKKVLCVCVCGEMVEKLTSEVKSYQHKVGHGKDCWIRNLYSIHKDIYRNCKKGAKTRNLKFDVNFEDFVRIVSKNCTYCGAFPPMRRALSHRRPGVVASANGIDRVNNELGYVTGNMVPCCTTCNMMKGSLNEYDFKLQCKAITKKFYKEIK